MQLLYEHAESKSDDIMSRLLRQRMIGDDRAKRDATSDAATFLRKRLADLEEDEAKRRKAELEEHRLAANEYERLKIASEKAKEDVVGNYAASYCESSRCGSRAKGGSIGKSSLEVVSDRVPSDTCGTAY